MLCSQVPDTLCFLVFAMANNIIPTQFNNNMPSHSLSGILIGGGADNVNKKYLLKNELINFVFH